MNTLEEILEEFHLKCSQEMNWHWKVSLDFNCFAGISLTSKYLLLFCRYIFDFQVFTPYCLPTEVILRTINHALVMMTTRDLSYFKVPEEEVLPLGTDLSVATIQPVERMTFLKFVGDDETTQQKAFLFMFDLFSGLGLRGFPESETSHPSWNAFRKAVSHSGLTIAVMKLTLCCALPELESAVQFGKVKR